ncbi:MAG: tetratricopeptide repeat protein [Spirochaetaceae bacterium]|nr:tetratricopeptide repeat protein [Spirochaetaceae bacterium]MBO5236704.1 tetratricopeptide repeat protein [Spirochaetaceae bacterium]
MTDNNKEQKKTASEKISNFLAKYRFFLIGIIVACIVVAIVLGIVLTVMDSSKEKALSQLDKIVYSLTQVSAEELPAAQDKALDDILALTQGKGGKVAKVRGNMAAAEIYFSRQQWQEACDAWLNAALADEKAYTAAVCYFNAAVAYEELGNSEAALANYEKVLQDSECLFVPRAIFSLGRINESLNDYATASNWYNKLVDEYASDNWASLAKSRLIELEIESKIQ